MTQIHNALKFSRSGFHPESKKIKIKMGKALLFGMQLWCSKADGATYCGRLSAYQGNPRVFLYATPLYIDYIKYKWSIFEFVCSEEFPICSLRI